jgi:predicted DCC family thiol-disulfide oxidoreductase YuxK
MPYRGTIFYDATCGLCTAARTRFGRAARRAGFTQTPMQDPVAQSALGLSDGEMPTEMKVQLADGTVLGGVDALLAVCRHIAWAWPAWAISRVPGVAWLLRCPYRLIARNRYRISQVCKLRPEAPR